MIAITGATGHLGQATLRTLLTNVAPDQLVAVVRDPQKAADLAQAGVQVRPGDYNDAASLATAFQGVDTLLFVSTSELEYDLRMRQHHNVIDAARQAGVRRVVYTSVLNPSRESKFGASPSHLATEEYLRASGLIYTVFRNTFYLDILPMFIGEAALPTGKMASAAGAGEVSYALREEIAEALAHILTTPGHDNQTYDIAPGPAYSMQDVAATLSEVAGKPVEYVPISLEELAAGMRQHQVPESVVALTVGITGAMQDNEFSSVSPALEQLLGRQPTDLKTYLTTIYGS